MTKKTSRAIVKAAQQEKNVVRLIKKSNDLVEARYKFDIWETRVFTKMLTMIKPTDEDFKGYRIYLKDIVEDFDLAKDNRAYKRLKQAGKKLTKKSIKTYRDTDEGEKEFYTPIVAGVDSFVKEEDGKYIDVSFHPQMRPHLLALKSRFTIYDARNVLKLPSSYSIRIYELLKQYEKIGKRKFDLDHLKEMIGAREEIEDGDKEIFIDHYPLYGNFRQKVLLKAQKDLAKYTDLAFTFEPIKKGRKTAAVLFFIIANQAEPKQTPKKKAAKTTEKTASQAKEVTGESPLFKELYPKVSQWIGKGSFEKLLKEHPEQQLRNAITYTVNRIKKGEKIANVAGYIVAMTKQTSLFDAVEETKQKKTIKRKQVAENEAKKVELKEAYKKIKSEWFAKEKILMQALFIQNSSLKAEVFEQTKTNKFAGYDANKTEEENMQDPQFLGVFCNKIKKQYPEMFVALTKEYEPKVKKIRRAIDSL